MQIPWQQLAPDTLEAMLGEIVTRDGTDYGAVEKSTAQKLTYAINQLKSGLAVLYWDAELESASLLSPEQVARLEKEQAQID